MSLLLSSKLISPVSRRQFSQSNAIFSHIGSLPVYTTQETKFDVSELRPAYVIRKGNKSLKLSQIFSIKGPKGSLYMRVPEFVSVHEDTDAGKLSVSVRDEADKMQKSLWGTVRSHLHNHVVGVNEGHMAVLKFVGTGYRAQVEQDGKFVSVKVGASVMQGLPVPVGITVASPTPTSLIIEGCDKQQVYLFAANLRKFHPPEPYKGKGIYINDEKITLKDKKIK
ncbi:LANO_0F16028g1_1 [Lachancea nothofagi CBS 11611]|uniref:Large ribosomal subunit protein uL6m n=1 Tax=Lachancea nothofagi CBS 11611 TaxID=1266666 RepID=A0A1G4KCS8_9SACH|nr:LANO_0F16028g1_1 [Lachancea nothofagi CBS 11611]